MNSHIIEKDRDKREIIWNNYWITHMEIIRGGKSRPKSYICESVTRQVIDPHNRFTLTLFFCNNESIWSGVESRWEAAVILNWPHWVGNAHLFLKLSLLYWVAVMVYRITLLQYLYQSGTRNHSSSLNNATTIVLPLLHLANIIEFSWA